MSFDSTNGQFKAQYKVDTSIQASTVVYLSREYYYTNGYTFDIVN